MQSICVMLQMFVISARIVEILHYTCTFFLSLYIVEGGTEGICTCTEEHEIKYECHDEQKQISPFAQGKVVTLYIICMMNNNP